LAENSAAGNERNPRSSGALPRCLPPVRGLFPADLKYGIKGASPLHPREPRRKVGRHRQPYRL